MAPTGAGALNTEWALDRRDGSPEEQEQVETIQLNKTKQEKVSRVSQNEKLSRPTVVVGSAKARACVVGRGGQKRRSAGQEPAARSPQQPADRRRLS